MFDIGFWELAVIAVVALVVIGPERLPGVARTAGRWIGSARRFVQSVQADINAEVSKADVDQEELGSSPILNAQHGEAEEFIGMRSDERRRSLSHPGEVMRHVGVDTGRRKLWT